MAKAKTTTIKKAPDALKCYFPRRNSLGVVEVTTRVLCAPHRNAIFSFEPAAYGCGELSPASACEMCRMLAGAGHAELVTS